MILSSFIDISTITVNEDSGFDLSLDKTRVDNLNDLF